VYFIEHIWLARHLDKFAPIGEIERDICQWAANGPTRQGILAPRGFGKTHLVTAGLSCWDLWRNPNAKVQVVSKSEGEAKKTIFLIRQWIETVPFLQHLRPSKKWQRDSATMFDVGTSTQDRTPSVVAKGVEGQLESTRAHRIIADDIETRENTKTLDARIDLDERIKEFTSIATYGERRINFIGTYHHEESVYLKLADRGYQFRTWPLLYPKPGDRILGLAPVIARALQEGKVKSGDIVCPYRFDDQYVAERQAEGRTYFAMQQMLIADLGDSLRYPLQLRDFIVQTVNRDKAPISIAWGTHNDHGGSTRIEGIPMLGFTGDALYSPIMFDKDWTEYIGTLMWIDPSGKGKDKTAYAIVSFLNGYLWVHTVEGLEGGHNQDVLDRLALAARKYNVGRICIEDFALQSMFGQLLDPAVKRAFLEPGQDPAYPQGWKAAVEMVKVPSLQKELRILNALEPVLGSHRIVLDPVVASNEALQYQLTRLTRQRDCLEHDDELEALAMACLQWQTSLNQDPEEAAQQQRDRWIEEQLEEHRRLAGEHVPEPAWFHHQT
jgi:hypothetical protein